MNIIAVCINIIVCTWLFSLCSKEHFECGTLTFGRLSVSLQHRMSATMAIFNIYSTDSLERADHNWIPWYYEMNFIICLSVSGPQSPVTLTEYQLLAYIHVTCHEKECNTYICMCLIILYENTQNHTLHQLLTHWFQPVHVHASYYTLWIYNQSIKIPFTPPCQNQREAHNFSMLSVIGQVHRAHLTWTTPSQETIFWRLGTLSTLTTVRWWPA